MNRMHKIAAALLVSLCFMSARPSSGQEITVAAAADLQFAFQDVAAKFQKDTGHSVKADFWLVWELLHPNSKRRAVRCILLRRHRLSKKTRCRRPRRNRNALRIRDRQDRAVGAEWIQARSEPWLASVARSGVKKIAIANPEHAPYGRAAVAALRHEGIYEKVADKFVLGENISQTASFVVSGNADIGIVALSLAVAPAMKDKGRYAEIPADEYPAIEQAAIVLKSSKQKDTARQFLDYLKTNPMKELLKSYGFAVAGDRPSTP